MQAATQCNNAIPFSTPLRGQLPAQVRHVKDIGHAMKELLDATERLRHAVENAGGDSDVVLAPIEAGQDETFDIIDELLEKRASARRSA